MNKLRFSYCFLISIFFWRKSNNLINKIQERSLRIVTNDKNSNFEDLLRSNNQITVHLRNFQVLIAKVFKIINGLSPPMMDKFLIFCKNTHIIRNFQIFMSNKNEKIVRYGQETITFRTSSLWANLPEEYKLAHSFKN